MSSRVRVDAAWFVPSARSLRPGVTLYIGRMFARTPQGVVYEHKNGDFLNPADYAARIVRKGSINPALWGNPDDQSKADEIMAAQREAWEG